MWRNSASDSFVDENRAVWTNIGETYTHHRSDGSSVFFYQKTNQDGDMTLASHTFSPNETAAFGLFHSNEAREAAMQDHVNPTWGSFLSMVAKEMKAQWTDPYLLTAGAMIGIVSKPNTPGTVLTPIINKNVYKKSIHTISGYTRHGLNQAISRNGGKGVHPAAILDATRNPQKVSYQSDGRIKYTGKNATVILNNNGKIITTYGKPRN